MAIPEPPHPALYGLPRPVLAMVNPEREIPMQKAQLTHSWRGILGSGAGIARFHGVS